MKREEAIKFWEFRYENAKDFSDPHWEAQERREHREYVEALRVAIEALKAEPIRCGECKHQDECEEMVLFDVNDDEVMGHRLHWCSYGERKGGGDE